MKKYICIHGHFYQPPRENPWLNQIEVDDSASPYHDWNTRITHECYQPNAFARVLNDQDEIIKIINNYRHISFNFGPTLLSWLEVHNPDTYQRILTADQQSLLQYGAGNAVAQVYNHLIMPLASRQDKELQVLWGIADFVKRFGRQPEGMWLAETGVDLETLEVLAEHGIRYTILAPKQAKAFSLDGKKWTESKDSQQIDPTRPYVQKLPNGKSIVLFFYDAPLSHAIAFEKLLADGNRFFNRLKSTFREDRDWPQLVHIATDGESYGHHFFHGEMALAYAINLIHQQPDIELINYSSYLDQYPPTAEVDIHENTAWSCAHGLGRWQTDCGCNTGAKEGWQQKWRGPLREAFNGLRDGTDAWLQTKGAAFYNNTEAAIRAYIDLVLHRHDDDILARFKDEHLLPNLSEDESYTALQLLEMKYNANLIYTSCAWFFNDISGIEPVQIMKYAARLIGLSEAIGLPLDRETFLKQLAKAPSNLPEYDNGEDIFVQLVSPHRKPLKSIVAHWAMRKLLVSEFDTDVLFDYRIEPAYWRRSEFNQLVLAVGRLNIYCNITGRLFSFDCLVYHLSGLDLRCYVKFNAIDEDITAIAKQAMTIFEEKSLAELIKFIPTHFSQRFYALNDLFADDRRAFISLINSDSMMRMASRFNESFAEHKKLFTQMRAAGYPMPQTYQSIIRFGVLNHMETQLKELFNLAQNGQNSKVERFIDASDQLLQWQLKVSPEIIQNTIIPATLRLFDLFVGEHLTPGNLLIVLKKLRELAPEIDFWKLQDQLILQITSSDNGPRIADDDYLALLKYLKINDQIEIEQPI
jgi:alpha-amylase/alpha-mannosidase (GH57 family)